MLENWKQGRGKEKGKKMKFKRGRDEAAVRDSRSIGHGRREKGRATSEGWRGEVGGDEGFLSLRSLELIFKGVKLKLQTGSDLYVTSTAVMGEALTR